MKTFNIKAFVKRPPVGTPWGTEEIIADMLRYDCMYIVKKDISDPLYVIYTLRGKVRFTKARWNSFNIKTEVI